MSQLTKIKTKLSIHTQKRSMLMLEGEYASQLKGKSLDFDDLREYAYGDDVRDIDWRASAKQQNPLVKRYIAHRRHNVLFVMDSSVTMQAAAPDYHPKYELAATVMGLLGYIASKNNDNLSLLLQTTKKIEQLPYLSGEKHLNRMLETYEKTVQATVEASGIENLLQHAHSSLRVRTIMIVVADELTPSDSLKTLLNKLQHRHDLIWVSVADINPVSVPPHLKVLDVIDSINIPEGLRADKNLISQMFADEQARKTQFHDFLKSLRVSNTVITDLKDIIPGMLALLKRREHEQRSRRF